MSKVSKKFSINRTKELLKAGHLKELIEFIKDNNLEKDINYRRFLRESLGFDLGVILSSYDPEKNAVILDQKSIENILYNPSIIPFLLMVDRSLLDKVPENIKNFMIFVEKEYKEGRLGDIISVNEILRYPFNDQLDEYFDGEKFSSKVYQSILVTYYDYSDVKLLLSPHFFDQFTPHEKKLLKIMTRLNNQEHISDKKNESYDRVYNFVLHCKREDIPRFVKIVPGMFRKYVDINLNEELLKNIIFYTVLKKDYYGPELENLEEISGEAFENLAEAQRLFFKLNDESINDALEKLGFNYEDLDDLIYTKEGKLYFEPKVLPLILKQKNYSALLKIAYEFIEEDRVDEIKFDDENITAESVRALGKAYYELSKLEDTEMPLQFLLSNLDNERNFLLLEPEKINKIEYLLIELCKRIKASNTQELKKHGGVIIYQLLENCDETTFIPTLDKIEELFENDYLPVVAKKFLIYRILNPNLETKDLSEDKIISPTLKSINPTRRYALIFGDLMRISFGNNNVELRHYLKNLYYGNCLYEKVLDKSLNLDNLPPYEKEVLETFLGQLCSLYNNSQAGKENPYEMSGDLIKDLNHLAPLFKPTNDYSLLDRIIRMYGFQAGFSTFEEACEYMNKAVKEADERGRRLARGKIELEKGDMIKGIGHHKYLYSILQNGSLCKEFLGADLSSDATPLDTDLSMIDSSGKTFEKAIENTKAGYYGSVWIVIKKDKYPITRTKAKGETLFTTRGPECFTTLDDHHIGIRTGFPSTDIDYIIVDEKYFDGKEKKELPIDMIKFNIVLNGFYIPVVDKKTGRLLFTPEEYDLMRAKMDGLSYFGCDEYELSPNLDVPTDYDNKDLIEDAQNKKKHINAFIGDVMKEKFGYDLVPRLSKNVEVGHVQLIDTGSTGRGTNVSKDTDFDFIMRVDEGADKEAISRAICDSLGIDYEEAKKEGMVISGGNLRLKDVNIPNLDHPVSLDITFLSKADELSYTTDMALKDRLDTIKRLYPDKYEDVLDNIIYAKQFLKEAGVYKPTHSREASQGGLGGVGIENWVLQNGGSFYDACAGFVRAATDEKGNIISFEEFKKKYKIFDYGENFYDGKHDEFVKNNMSKEGFKIMYKACTAYLITHKKEQTVERKGTNPNDIPIDFNSIRGRNK